MNKLVGKWVLLAAVLILMTGCDTQTDLYSQAQQAEWAAERAQREAEMLHSAMTATAGAPILQITEQAAALELQRQRDGMTATAYHSTLEASWTPTPNVTSTYVMAVAIAQQTQIASDQTRNLLELERQQNSNRFKALLPGLTFAFLAVVAIWVIMTITRRERMRVVPRDARGDAPLLLDVVDGVTTDIDASPNYQTGTRRLKKPEDDPVPQLPTVTAERQDKVKGNDQLLDLATRGLPGQGGKPEERKQLAAEAAMRQLPAGAERFKVLGPGEKPPASVVDDETIEILDAQWKEVEDVS